jgi:hypothetical protein
MEYKVIRFKFNDPVYHNGRSHFEMYSIVRLMDSGDSCPIRRIREEEEDINGNGWVAQNFNIEYYLKKPVNIAVNDILMDSIELPQVKVSLITLYDAIDEYEYCD